MARLPRPASDEGQWGEILNDFLKVEHFNNSADPNDPKNGTLTSLIDLSSRYVKPAGGVTEAEFDSVVQAKLNAPPTTDVGDGTVTDAKVAPGAAIAQSKIAGLGTALSGKLDTTEPRLSNARTIMKVNGAVVGAGVARKTLNLNSGANVDIEVGDNQPRNSMDTVIARTVAPADVTTTLNVADFGASGNKATDCTTAFQKALAKLQSLGGGILYVPRGGYQISGPLNTAGVHLVGEGQSATSLLWSQDLGSSSTSVFAIDMNSAGPDLPAGSIEGITLYGPGNSTWGVRAAWMHGIRMCRGGIVRDLQLAGFNSGIQVEHGREKLQNFRLGSCYVGIYFATTASDSGGQMFSDAENQGHGFACFMAGSGAVIRDNVVSGLETALTPFAYFKEGTPGEQFIDGITFVLWAQEYVGNGVFYAPGLSIKNITMLACGSWGMMQQPPFITTYPAEAPVVCGAMKNWRVLGQNPFSTPGSTAVFKCDSMTNLSMDMVSTGSSAEPVIVCAGQIRGSEFRRTDVSMHAYTTTTPLQRGDLVEAGPNGTCRQYNGGILIGVCMETSVAAGNQVLIARQGLGNEIPVQVRVAIPGSMTRTTNKFLKPDPSNPGCAIEASGPQDGITFGVNTTNVTNGLVNCLLLGFA